MSTNISKNADPRFWARWRKAGAVQDFCRSPLGYDTREGILACIKTLEGLNALTSARIKAGYDRGEHLNKWVVLGRFYFDSCGNTMIMDPPSGKTVPPGALGNVLTREEFFSGPYKQYWGDEGCMMRHMARTGNTIPPAHACCPVCGKGWTMANVNDCEAFGEELVEPLQAFVGKTFADVRHAYMQRTDAEYLVTHEKAIRNDKWIGSAGANELGWTRDNVSNYYVIREGDEVFVYKFTHEHAACRKERIALAIEKQFRAVFRTAGYDNADALAFKRVPNLRGPESEYYKGPGFKVTAPFGEITIGWRKSVIEIHWPEKDLAELFDDVETTKNPMYIHAYGYEQAGDFLARIKTAFAPSTHATP